MAHQLAFPITKVIKDNLSLVMMFAYSQPPLREFRRGHFTGNWPYIDEVLFALPEQLATRAFIKLVCYSACSMTTRTWTTALWGLNSGSFTLEMEK